MEYPLLNQIWFLLFIAAIAIFILYYIYSYRRSDQENKDNTAYLLGLKAMVEGEHRLAIEKFKEAVHQDTNNVDAYIKLGDVLRQSELSNNAIRIHKDLTLRGNIPEEQLRQLWYSLALDYWAAGKPDQAEVYLQKLLPFKRYKEKITPKLIELYEEKANYEKAFQILNKSQWAKSAEHKKKLALYKVLSALPLLENGKGKEARIAFKDALKIDDGNSAAYTFIGDSYLNENRLDDAIKTWMEFCKKYPKRAFILFPRLEKAWYDKGQFDKTEALYEQILKKDSNNRSALIALSRIYTKKGDYPTAIQLIEEGIKQGGEVHALKAELTRIYQAKSQYKDAANTALEILDNIPQTSAEKPFVCPSCQLQTEDPFWKCPKCHALNLQL